MSLRTGNVVPISEARARLTEPAGHGDYLRGKRDSCRKTRDNLENSVDRLFGQLSHSEHWAFCLR